MNWILLPVTAMSSLCFFVGIYYLWMYNRQREERVNLFFALTCLAITLYTILCAGLYNATSFETGLVWQRLKLASLTIFCISILWFIYHFTNYYSKKPFIIFSILLFILFILGLSIYSDMTLSADISEPNITYLTSYLSLNVYEARPGLIYLIQYAILIAALIFIIYVTFDLYWGERDRHTLIILLSLTCFFFAAVNDILVSLRIYSFIYVLEYAFMLIIISNGLVLQDRFIDLHREVEELNELLEDKANEGVMDLFLTEIGTRLYIEMINDLSGIKQEFVDSTAIQNLINSDKASSIIMLSREISMISNVDKLLKRVATKIKEISNAQSCFLFFADDDGQLILKSYINELDHNPEAWAKQLVEKAFSSGEYLITDSIKDELSHANNDDQRTRYAACIPIIAKDKTIGVCYLENNISRNIFTHNDILLLYEFLAQLAIPIENAFERANRKDTGRGRRGLTISLATEVKLEKAISYIKENYLSDISREGLAASLNMHPDSLGRFFKMYTGKKINEYINDIRLEDAAKKLEETDDNIIDIAYSVGFESLTTFNRVFRKSMKLSPARYREKYRKTSTA